VIDFASYFPVPAALLVGLTLWQIFVVYLVVRLKRYALGDDEQAK
jgi:hypothetical protein